MKFVSLVLALMLINISGTLAQTQPPPEQTQPSVESPPTTTEQKEAAKPAPVMGTQTAIFAGGCFWCMESEFESQAGVSAVTSGYAGGEAETPPTYEEVSTGTTGFKEAVAVTYDPSIVTYQQLIDIFWSNVDPFDEKGQFCDKGAQYVAAIFVSSPEEDKLAHASLASVEAKFGRKVATQILPQTTFYEAEDHHQDYYKTNAERYESYRTGCGRDSTLERIWGPKPKALKAAPPAAQ